MSSTNKKILSQGIFMWNIKALALTAQKLLARLKFSKVGQTPRSQGQNVGTQQKILPQGILMWNIKALALMVEKL